MQSRHNPERMKKLLARRARHGWSWVELSRRSSVPLSTLYWWKTRLEKQVPDGQDGRKFVPIRIVESSVKTSSPLEVITPGGFRILVTAEFDAAHLQSVIKAVESVC